MAAALKNNPLVFVTGIAGIGKSEFAKHFAKKNEKKYTNIIYLYYTGNLKKCVAELEFASDTAEMTEPELVAKIIDLLNAHTLTVSLAALTLEASDMDMEEFLYELKTTGIRTDISEEVELYKDETFSYGRMMEHLRKLLQLSRLSEGQLDILRNL